MCGIMHEWIDGGGSLNPKWSHRIPGWKDSPGHCILGYSEHGGGGGGWSPNPLTPSRSQAHLHLWEPHPHELRHDHVVPSPNPAPPQIHGIAPCLLTNFCRSGCLDQYFTGRVCGTLISITENLTLHTYISRHLTYHTFMHV